MEWIEVSGSGSTFKKERYNEKFSPELESLATELTGKTPRKIFVGYNIPDEDVCIEIEEELGISIMTLDTVLKDFIRIAKKNVDKGRYPYSPSLPLRSLLQTMIDLELIQ